MQTVDVIKNLDIFDCIEDLDDAIALVDVFESWLDDLTNVSDTLIKPENLPAWKYSDLPTYFRTLGIARQKMLQISDRFAKAEDGKAVIL
uniref:Uncharacterized protein n=1 Tax=Myoviridae sp. ctuev19 TaxID=2827716 RepID=A0A8S5SG80_9CAUD|nr:MAG TPA: hypothetical protein [Myoviridae sp. ctuev19]